MSRQESLSSALRRAAKTVLREDVDTSDADPIYRMAAEAIAELEDEEPIPLGLRPKSSLVWKIGFAAAVALACGFWIRGAPPSEQASAWVAEALARGDLPRVLSLTPVFPRVGVQVEPLPLWTRRMLEGRSEPLLAFIYDCLHARDDRNAMLGVASRLAAVWVRCPSAAEA